MLNLHSVFNRQDNDEKGLSSKMTFLNKIRLSGKFGKTYYVISGIMTLAASALVLFSPTAIPVCILLKLFSIPVILYLLISLQKGMSIFFYINLGISRIEYYAIPVAMEFVIFVLMMIISGNIGYAIQ